MNQRFLIETVGLWEPENENRILIKRNQLNELNSYAGTLLHECAHAISGASMFQEILKQSLPML